MVQLDSPATAERLRVAVCYWIVQWAKIEAQERGEGVFCTSYGFGQFFYLPSHDAFFLYEYSIPSLDSEFQRFLALQ